ncbi:MAG: hypothetical protein JSV86_01510 [Gemmatimonadota bacterium]|nr:MAG: hypothetical protein JSV86_01510 [Gemmatimonadota bacterium]
MSYESSVHSGMEELFERTRGQRRELDIDAARWIIFSDHHRGERDGADDFQRCEAAYHAALGYYLEAGYRLILLGDVEELWESRPGAVFEAYAYTLELEGQFYDDRRYDRFWGNHDDEWEYGGAVDRCLGKVHPGVEVKEGECFRVTSCGEELGTLFLAHGHQGTKRNDRYRALSRFFVRYTWRPLQRLTRLAYTTPARSFVLRNRHDIALYNWAAAQQRLVLIAGHTHRPVFMGCAQSARVEERIAGLLEDSRRHPPSPSAIVRVAELRAELEWVRARGDDVLEKNRHKVASVKPCYFNSGCCSFSDGGITGIDISDGRVKLIQWPDDKKKPKPQTLAEADLKTEVFGAL